MYDLNQIKLNFRKETTERLENISDEAYFGEEYREYISNSSLKLINPDEGGSPTKFLVGNKSSGNNTAFELGTAVHRLILEKDKYYVNDVVKPDGKGGIVIESYFNLLKQGVDADEAIRTACEMNDYYTKSLTQARIDKLLEAGKPYLEHLQEEANCESCITLSSEMKDKLDSCLVSVSENKLIQDLLYPGEGVKTFNEDVIIMKVNATMVSPDPLSFEDATIEMFIKGKIDNWSVDVENKILTLNDLKSTGGSIASFGGVLFETAGLNGDLYVKRTEGSFQKFRYYRQMAMYAFMLQSHAEEVYGFDDTWTFRVNMLVVETSAPYLSHVFQVSTPWLLKGKHEFQSLLKRIAYHRVNGFDKFTDVDLNKITTL